jgi:hypothetical protein
MYFFVAMRLSHPSWMASGSTSIFKRIRYVPTGSQFFQRTAAYYLTHDRLISQRTQSKYGAFSAATPPGAQKRGKSLYIHYKSEDFAFGFGIAPESIPDLFEQTCIEFSALRLNV